MPIITGKEQKLLPSGLAVFGLIGRHRRPGWPSSAAGMAVISGRSGRHWRPVGRHWRPEWPTLAAGVADIGGQVAVCGRGGHHWPDWPSEARVAIIGLIGHLRPGWPSVAEVAIFGLGGHLWPGWPSLAWFSRHHQQHADGLLVKGGVD